MEIQLKLFDAEPMTMKYISFLYSMDKYFKYCDTLLPDYLILFEINNTDNKILVKKVEDDQFKKIWPSQY